MPKDHFIRSFKDLREYLQKVLDSDRNKKYCNDYKMIFFFYIVFPNNFLVGSISLI